MTIRIYLCPIKEKQKLVRATGFGMEQQENIKCEKILFACTPIIIETNVLYLC